MASQDTFDLIADAIEKYAHDFPPDPIRDPDGNIFRDGLATFEVRALRVYEDYQHRRADEYFKRPRRSFGLLRGELAEQFPKKFELPAVASGRDAAPPYQWAVEDARACRLLASFAAGATQAGSLPNEGITLDRLDAGLLRWLGQCRDQPSAVAVERMCGEKFGDRKTIGRSLRRLHQAGVVRYQRGSKKGANVTDLGRDWLNQNPE